MNGEVMHPFRDRVAVLGFPDSLERYHAHAPAPWSAASLVRLKELGFTAIQNPFSLTSA
jgi:hypothetical protein